MIEQLALARLEIGRSERDDVKGPAGERPVVLGRLRIAGEFERHPVARHQDDVRSTPTRRRRRCNRLGAPYHRGDFAAAVEEGTALGPIGANAANKAANIYATYLETDGGRKREIFLKSAERAEELQVAAPDFVNAFYFHARALGHYSQEISIVKALAQGIGGRVKASLDKALKLEPNHAEGFVRVTAGRQRVAQHAHPQATFKSRGRATRPMWQSVSACRLGG